MQIKLSKEQVPWAMAAGRALLGPVLIAGDACSWSGPMMAWLVVTALVSDIFDGVLARRWHCDTAGVRLFDSMADTVFYVCAAIALWMGFPQVWRANEGLLAVLLGLEAARFGLDFAKFGKPASYHSYMAKAWGLVMVIAVVAVFASGRPSALFSAALALGIVCELEGLAMSLMLPVWRKDVKTLRAAWLLRGELHGECRWTGRATRATLATLLALCLLAVPASALEPGQAVYAGGTAKIALDTLGVLDMTSGTELVFRYKEPNGMPGEVGIAYPKIRSVESRNDVVRHLGFLPAVAVGLVAARQRRYTLTVSYADSSDAMQVATFQVDRRDQLVVKQILRARAPQSCMAMPYRACAGNPAMRPETVTAPK